MVQKGFSIEFSSEEEVISDPKDPRYTLSALGLHLNVKARKSFPFGLSNDRKVYEKREIISQEEMDRATLDIVKLLSSTCTGSFSWKSLKT